MVILVIFEILKHTVLFLMSPLVILERLLEFPSVEEIIFTRELYLFFLRRNEKFLTFAMLA